MRVGYFHAFSIGYGGIPCAMEQGIFSREQGNLFLDQGIAQWFGRRFNALTRTHLYPIVRMPEKVSSV